MKTTIVISTLTSVVLTVGAIAQPRMLSIEESVRLGLENSKVLHASQMKSVYADAKASEMGTLLYPSVKVQAAYQKLSEVPEFKIPLPGFPAVFPYIPNTYTARASFQQPVFTGWKLQGAADNASYQAEAARSDVTKDKSDLVYTIKSQYWNLFRAKEVKRLADENVNQISAHLKDVENLFKQGLATANDVLKLKVQLSNSNIMQSDAANNVRLASISLNSTIGLPLDLEIGIASTPTPSSREFPELPTLLSSAAAHRPEVLAMESRVRASDAAVASAIGGWFPQIFLTGNYYYARPNQRYIPSVDAFKDTWDFGVSLQFDLWNNLSTVHQTSQAKAQYEQLRDGLATLKDGITLEVTQCSLAFKQSGERIRLSELSVEQANENYRMTAEKFKTGLMTSTELIDAQVSLLQAKLQLTEALVEHELAEARLEKAIGELH